MVESTVIYKEKIFDNEIHLAEMYIVGDNYSGNMIVLFEHYNSGTIVGHPDKKMIGQKICFDDLSKFKKFEGEVILKNEAN